MIQQGINISSEMKEKVKRFCSLNNVEWSDNVYESVTGGIVGEVDDVVKVMDYINKLEQDRLNDRKIKGFWYRILAIIYKNVGELILLFTDFYKLFQEVMNLFISHRY